MSQQLTSQPSAHESWRPRRTPSTGDVVSGLVVAAVLLSADIHLVLYFGGYSNIPVIGPLFVLNAVGGMVIGVAVLIWRHWLPVLAAIGFGAATLTAFLLSRTVGLLGLHLPTWDPQAVLAMAGDAVALVSGAVLLLRRRAGRR
jgi:hypothetical protein